jgi:hypothetical protein
MRRGYDGRKGSKAQTVLASEGLIAPGGLLVKAPEASP